MLSQDADSPIATISEQICVKKAKTESCWTIMLQVFPTFIIAGLGMVAAGVVLNQVQYWPVFTEVGVIIMVPALLGLKGNLEMTLASRLSTACNLGKLDCKENAVSMILGNLVLVQCQGIVVGFLASLVGMAMGWLPDGKFDIDHAMLLCASAVVTASIASFTLGVVMVGVILLAKRFKCNPDNVATPIAASLGDVTTLGLLAWIANLLYIHMLEDRHTALIIIVVYFLVLPFLFYLSYKNEHTCLVLCTGWTPVLTAMLISSGGGLILDKAVEHFKGIAVFSPVMNGAGGNLVAIQASRMTTYLNKATNSLFGIFPPEEDDICILPCSALCGGYSSCGGTNNIHNASIARVLLLILFPGHIVFIAAICFLESLGTPTPLFFLFYLVAALSQVAVLLYLCQILVYWMWSKGTDPDNAAIPYLTAIGDLLGTAFLALSFLCLNYAGDDFLQGIENDSSVENVTVVMQGDAF
eukprot:GFUD01018441.1.p1 GENE.GFUD01018441.1~~GFUD01018441.1.p1  ORF type:complete len:470 (+),score=42.68 GFUD01018441.1:662-2071(+)